MLEKANGLLFDKLSYHVAQDGSDGVKSFVCSANIAEANVIKKDLLNNKDCDGL